MSLQSSALLFVLLFITLVPCIAQQPSGPPTLDDLASTGESPEPQRPAGRPYGALARPADGVKHPDLDKAWADYDEAVEKVAAGIKAAISKQFDTATAKGDLDAAEKWQVIGEKFEKAGVLPTESEAKAAVSSASSEYKKAREELTKAYESVVKSLTMEKKIAEAKAAREEMLFVAAAKDVQAAVGKRPTDEWSVLFRSDKPTDWDTAMDFKGRYAVPLSEAPRDIRFLRLKRMSNGNSIIIPISNEMLGRNGAVSEKYGWAGANANSWGGHHLGVYLNRVTPKSRGAVICIHLVGYDVYEGWGFGHKVTVDDKQYFSWGGTEVPKESFEVSVKCSDLSTAEKRILLK